MIGSRPSSCPLRRVTARYTAVALLLGACSQAVPTGSDAVAEDLAGTAAVEIADAERRLPDPPPASSAPREPSATDPGSSGTAGTEATARPASSTPPAATTPPRSPPPTTAAASPAARAVVVANLGDARGDAGLDAPAYADLLQVLVEETETTLRITVVVAGALPTSMADGEVIGVGVDLYAPGQSESRYQVFADGGSAGWEAYLTGPDGVEALPGTFALGRDRMEFVFPASRVDLRSGEISAFLDRSKRGELLPVASTDRAPDRGRARFTRP